MRKSTNPLKQNKITRFLPFIKKEAVSHLKTKVLFSNKLFKSTRDFKRAINSKRSEIRNNTLLVTLNIGNLLRKKEKSVVIISGIGNFTKKTMVSLVATFLIFSMILTTLPLNQISQTKAISITTYEMAVNLNEYAINVQDSNYYAWRGKVNLSGEIATNQVVNSSITAYLDESLTPVFKIEKSLMVVDNINNKYDFATQIDTSGFKRGFHTLRLYDGDILSFTDKESILNVPVYFEYSEIATVVNVTDFCNMRQSATRDSNLLTSVPKGASIDVLDQETGQYTTGTGPDSSYATSIWYKIRYETTSATYTGYVLSAFLKKITTGISKMQIKAVGTSVEEFQPGNTSYQVNIPYSTFDLSVDDIVTYNKDDTVKVVLNNVEVSPPYSSLPLITGENKVEFISRNAQDSTQVTYTYNIWRIAESTEAEFQAQLGKFPESYKPALRVIHSKYPKWLFTAFNTNLNWSNVISAHDSGNTSLIEISTLAQYKYSDIIKDGDSFVRASRAAVEYYMDPRNFLDESTVFQFEQLSYQSSMHTLVGIQKLLSGSGLAGYEAMFLKAGVDSKVSPYHLAARSRQEVTTWSSTTGPGLSTIATGKYSGAGNIYLGFYNFYNIGTNSGLPDHILWRGLNYAMGNKTTYIDIGGTEKSTTAEMFFKGMPKSDSDKAKYQLPWDSALKAIVGGGIYIGESYINKGQDTLYLQKFDVDPINGIYTHEYMQNIRAPFYEAKGPYNAYSQTTSLDNSFVFRIPVYQNMPSLKSPKPEDTNKLQTLEVNGYSMSPNFLTDAGGPYCVTVPTDIDKITISASTLNSNATIAGLGDKSISIGSDNTFVISCIPSIGEQRDYTIQVTRSFPEIASNNLLSVLTVTGLEDSLSPAFTSGQTGPFSANVSETTQTVMVSAVPQSNTATVTEGTGPHDLALGMNVISVKVKAQNGSERVYNVQITRKIPKAKSSIYAISNGTIKGISLLTTVGNLKSGIDSSIATLKVFSSSGRECSDTELVGTGTILRVYYINSLLEEHTIVIYGDSNGDGKVNSTDITALKSYILKLGILNGKFLDACDVNKDGKFNSTDYTIIKRHILKLQEISQT